MDKQNLDELRSVEELVSYQASVEAEIKEIDAEANGLPLKDEAREEFANLVDHNKQIKARVKELEARKRVIAELAEDPAKVERAFAEREREFESMARTTSSKENDIYNLRTMRHHPYMDPDNARAELRERAMRAVDIARYPTTDRAKAQEHIEKLLETTQEAVPGDVARHILATGSPAYRRAFGKTLAGVPLSHDEQRALSLAGSGGGFAIPFALDPTIIRTSNSVVNPARALARVVTIAGSNTWQGVTSPAIAAGRVGEATEATDNSTTLVQPQATVTKAHAFVPFTIEVDQDWEALQSEFGALLQDAKDDEEGSIISTSGFVTGNGSGNNPQGFVTGTTATSAAAGGLTVTAANLYALEAALPPRFRAKESFVANRGIYNVIRGIDTAGGAALWLRIGQGLATQSPTPGNTGATLLDRGAWEASAMQATVVNATKIMIVGDFSYFLIVDRIGMVVELIQQIMGNANRFPTGQRGLYAYWRNTSKVLSASAFVAMTGTT